MDVTKENTGGDEETRIPEATSLPALLLEYTAESRAVNVYWKEDGDAEKKEYVYAMPWAGPEPSEEDLLTLGQTLLDHIAEYASSLVEAYDEADMQAEVDVSHLSQVSLEEGTDG